MPCFFIAAALFLPRVAIAYLWFFTNWFTGVFDTLLWPILGFLMAPTTLLWYTVVDQVYQGSWGTFQIVILVIAVMLDFSPSTRKRKNSRSHNL